MRISSLRLLRHAPSLRRCARSYATRRHEVNKGASEPIPGPFTSFAAPESLATQDAAFPRTTNQEKNFADRESAERTEADLDSTLADAIAVAADALYGLEKRLLERFPRDKVYVRAFFLDVGSKRKKG